MATTTTLYRPSLSQNPISKIPCFNQTARRRNLINSYPHSSLKKSKLVSVKASIQDDTNKNKSSSNNVGGEDKKKAQALELQRIFEDSQSLPKPLTISDLNPSANGARLRVAYQVCSVYKHSHYPGMLTTAQLEHHTTQSLILKYKFVFAMESVAAAAVPRTSPVLLLPTVSASLSCKTPTRMSPSTRGSRLWSSRTFASMHDQDQQFIATTVTTIQPRKNQNYPSQDKEMKTDISSIERLELLEEQALQILNDGGGREATDYNTRAQIFDKCSKVFQALKHGE